jgi:hypothetical protein
MGSAIRVGMISRRGEPKQKVEGVRLELTFDASKG